MPDRLDDVERKVDALTRDRWAGAPANGGMPRIPQMVALPTASEALRFRLVCIPGTTDHVYVCLSVAGTYTWTQLD